MGKKLKVLDYTTAEGQKWTDAEGVKAILEGKEKMKAIRTRGSPKPKPRSSSNTSAASRNNHPSQTGAGQPLPERLLQRSLGDEAPLFSSHPTSSHPIPVHEEPATPIPPANRLSRLRNWLSLAGMVLAISALFAFVLLFAVDLFAAHANPYMGILAYVVAPMFLLHGAWAWCCWATSWNPAGSAKACPSRIPQFVLHVDLSRKRDRRLMVGFVGGSLGFLLLTAFGSYETYHLMETNSFCGETCHTPMEPEYKAYQHSAHAKVDCVACHIGPGTTAYIHTKVNGVNQLYHQIMRRLQAADRDPQPQPAPGPGNLPDLPLVAKTFR